jgi:hypothetical protein
VCDLSQAHAAARFKNPHVLPSLKELSAADCEVVHVLLPPTLHVDAALTLVASRFYLLAGLASACARLGPLPQQRPATYAHARDETGEPR